TQRPRPMRPVRLRGAAAWIALALGLVPVLVGFLVPAVHLAWQTFERLGNGGVSAQLLASARNTLLVALAATVVTVAAGLAVAWALRLAQGRRRARLAA